MKTCGKGETNTPDNHTHICSLISFFRDMIEKHQVCVRVIGDINLLPKDVQHSIARVVEFSKNYSRY